MQSRIKRNVFLPKIASPHFRRGTTGNIGISQGRWTNILQSLVFQFPHCPHMPIIHCTEISKLTVIFHIPKQEISLRPNHIKPSYQINKRAKNKNKQTNKYHKNTDHPSRMLETNSLKIISD